MYFLYFGHVFSVFVAVSPVFYAYFCILCILACIALYFSCILLYSPVFYFNLRCFDFSSLPCFGCSLSRAFLTPFVYPPRVRLPPLIPPANSSTSTSPSQWLIARMCQQMPTLRELLHEHTSSAGLYWQGTAFLDVSQSYCTTCRALASSMKELSFVRPLGRSPFSKAL